MSGMMAGGCRSFHQAHSFLLGIRAASMGPEMSTFIRRQNALQRKQMAIKIPVL